VKKGGIMLHEEKLYEGMPLELRVFEEEHKGRYRTRIEKINKPRNLFVGVPVAEKHWVSLARGTLLDVFFASNELTAYSFSSEIIGKIAQPVPSFIISYPKRIQKIQRRQYFRVPVIRTLKYRVIEKEEAGQIKSDFVLELNEEGDLSGALKYQIVDREGISEEKNGFMLNLSGGGLLFNADEALPLQADILLRAKIGADDMEILGRIIRCEQEEDRDFYQVSVEFRQMSEKTRDKIIRYVFEIQREMRRRGLL
jgi:c-di-GMP-binding flagellar brake protein YcgR